MKGAGNKMKKKESGRWVGEEVLVKAGKKRHEVNYEKETWKVRMKGAGNEL